MIYSRTQFSLLESGIWTIAIKDSSPNVIEEEIGHKSK